MTRIEYELLRDNRRELKLPSYCELNDRSLSRLAKLDCEKLVAYRTYILLSREIPEIEDVAFGEAFVQSTPL